MFNTQVSYFSYQPLCFFVIGIKEGLTDPYLDSIASINSFVPRIFIDLFRLYAKKVNENSPRTLSIPFMRQYAEFIDFFIVPNK